MNIPGEASVTQILGVPFFRGTAEEAVTRLEQTGGYVVVPAAPAMVRLRDDAEFRIAVTKADLAIADSGLMVLVWRAVGGGKVTRISGLAYLKCLLARPAVRAPGNTVWVLPSMSAAERARRWLRAEGLEIVPDDLYVAPRYDRAVVDETLLALLEHRRPAHVIVGIGGGPQEKLAHFLRDRSSSRPAIHCIGAALGFLTGDQVAIPDWADRLYLGWLLRLGAQPRLFIPRLAKALELPWLILRYRERLPSMRRA